MTNDSLSASGKNTVPLHAKGKKTILQLLPTAPYASVSEFVAAIQSKSPLRQSVFTPIGVELEITNVCNLRCRGCALIIDEEDKPKDVLSTEEYIDSLRQCKKAGMIGYSITGGEPFLFFDRLLELLSAHHELDLYKINTNGSAFTTPEKTKLLFSRLKKTGIETKNRYIKPVLVLSLGHQNLAGVPLENAVYATSLFYSFFSPERTNLSLNITEKNMLLARKLYEEFCRLYAKYSGHALDESTIDVRFFSLNFIPTLNRLQTMQKSPVRLTERITQIESEYISGGCFNIAARNNENEKEAETLIPRIVLRPNGDVYACPGYNRTHKIGRYQDATIQDIVQSVNKHPILPTVFSKNLRGLYELVEQKRPDIANVYVNRSYGPCDLCQLLTAFYTNIPLPKGFSGTYTGYETY